MSIKLTSEQFTSEPRGIAKTLAYARKAGYLPTQKVTIIGAGLAGLTTAYRLMQHGYEPTVYEARSRPGGRIYTAYYGASYDELGGKALNDGGDFPSIRALASEFGLSFENNESGKLKGNDQDSVSEAFKNAPPATRAMYEAIQKRNSAVNNLGELLDEFFHEYPKVREFLEDRARGYEGASTYELSTELFNNSWEFYKRGSQNAQSSKKNGGGQRKKITIQGGNSSLIQALVEKLQDKIIYNCPLKAISRGSDKAFKLEFEGKRFIESDIIVSAIPCTTLRDVSIQAGILPSDQLEAIQKITYGSASKILFPVTAEKEEQVHEKTEDLSKQTKRKTLVWLNGDKKVITLYASGVHTIDTSSKKGMAKIIEEETASIKRQHPDVMIQSTEVEDPPSAFPLRCSKNVGINWAQELYSKGSFSTLGAGQERLLDTVTIGNQTIRKAFRPIDGQLFFAGEHVPCENTGTMEAAAESGMRTSWMILNGLPK